MKRSKFISSPTFPRSLTSLDEELLADSKLSEESKLSVHELVTSLDSHSWADLVKDAHPTPLSRGPVQQAVSKHRKNRSLC